MELLLRATDRPGQLESNKRRTKSLVGFGIFMGFVVII